MTNLTESVPQELAPMLGDPHPLLAQIGQTGELSAPVLASSMLRRAQPRSLPELRSFLQSYRAELLIPLELPLILQAQSHASRGEARELIALDQNVASNPVFRDFAVASCRVGQRQLSRLRALRDQRIIRRYLEAVEQRRAHGWHTLVYGLSLGVFSVPLRQGLISYASHTLGGFIENAAGPLSLTVNECRDLQSEILTPVIPVVQSLLVPVGQPLLKAV